MLARHDNGDAVDPLPMQPEEELSELGATGLDVVDKDDDWPSPNHRLEKCAPEYYRVAHRIHGLVERPVVAPAPRSC